MQSKETLTNAKEIEKKLRESVQVEELAGGRLVYGLTDKKSDSGLMSNKRLVVIDEAKKIIGYSEEVPKELPVKDASKIKIKADSDIRTCQVKILKDEPKQINIACKANPKQSQKKSEVKQKDWSFLVNTAEIAKEWENQII